jgi:hypothetical protein
VDDDLVPLECRVPVRDDARLPVGAASREPQDLRRCLVLSAAAEGAVGELLLRLRRDALDLCTRARAATGREDDVAR